jgi:hypothetical protein
MAKYFALETLKGEDSIQASWNTNKVPEILKNSKRRNMHMPEVLEHHH